MLKTPTRKNLSKLKTIQVSKGTPGEKSAGFQRFKPFVEQESGKIWIPPHVIIPIEFFTPVLIRAGFLDDNGEEYIPKKGEIEERMIEWNRKEKGVIREACSQIQGFATATRSDERTAKGIGAFTTQFWVGGAGIVSTIEKQFNPTANAFKKKMGMPHGIGIQIMPTVGSFVTCHREKIIYPKISVAGYTAKDSNRLVVYAGTGVGSAVGKEAGMKIVKNGNGYIMYELENFLVIGPGGSKTRKTIYDLHDNPEMHLNGNRGDKISELCEILIRIARAAGTDFYFELQLTDDQDDVWAFTQIAEHTWPTVERPKGEEIIRATQVVGSTVVECPKFIRRADVETVMENPGACITAAYGTTTPTIRNFPNLVGIGASLESGTHGTTWQAHIAGIYREVGIPILRVQGSENIVGAVNINTAYRSIEGKGVIVWADELNERGGVVI